MIQCFFLSFSDVFTHRLSAVTSEAVAYRRIISERQNSTDEEGEHHNIISRWSTPPKFGLSPPGNSRLAKRRSLKQRLSALSLNGVSSTSHTEEGKSDSPTTPVQSPDVGTPVNERMIHRMINSSPQHNGKNEKQLQNSQKELLFDHVSNNGVINLSPDYSSGNSTPAHTPRNEQPMMKMF